MPILVIIGAKNPDELLGISDFRALGIEPILATEDGSVGIHGTVIDALDAIFGEVKPQEKEEETMRGNDLFLKIDALEDQKDEKVLCECDSCGWKGKILPHESCPECGDELHEA